MKIKLKITTRKIFKSIIALLFILNLVVLFFVYSFIKTQVLDTMFMTRDNLLKQSNLTVEDIDLERFNQVVEKIDKKKESVDISTVNNIFN